ncbi:MAG: membrane protein of unknown function [Promethearchaeota archaeon]|nr:MAG: membrane protein of unknown function [Candidatus Lokiarchaeota archaeon]
MVFILINFLIAVYLPLYGDNLKYKFGGFFSFIFNTIGTISLLMGFVYFIRGIVEFFTGSTKWIKHLIFGIIFLFLGSYLTGSIFLLFGKEIGHDLSSGYQSHFI